MENKAVFSLNDNRHGKAAIWISNRENSLLIPNEFTMGHEPLQNCDSIIIQCYAFTVF